jgi:hypothetical protein
MSESTHDLFIHGVAAAKAGENQEAIHDLEWMLEQDPDEDERLDACYWLAKVNPDPAVKRKYLEDVLAAQPYHLLARREWMLLNGDLKPEEVINPNEIKAPVPDGKAPVLDRFLCPRCGGRMVYSPDGNSLVCEFCEAKKIQQKSPAMVEQDFLQSMATIKGHSEIEGQSGLLCQSCGAAFILPRQTISWSCPFCNSVYVVAQTETRTQAAPSAIFPARLSAQAAKAAFERWRSKHGIPDPDKALQLQGIYLPAWWFSLGGQIHYRYEVHEKNKQPQHFEESQPVLRSNILIPASDHYREGLEKMIYYLNFDEMTAYKTEYLADWMAETYQVSVADASLTARQIGLEIEEGVIRSNLPANASEITFSSYDLMIESYQLVLLPAWVGQGCVSGQTGEVFIDALEGNVYAHKTIARDQRSIWERLISWGAE